MLSEHDIFILFLMVAVMLVVALLAGGLCKRLKVPSVVGELAAGIAIGPTIMGALSPTVFSSVFRTSDTANLALNALIHCASLFLLFVVGLEINVRSLRHEKRPISFLGSLGIVIPFLAGLGVGYLFRDMAPDGVTKGSFAALIGSAFAVSALPVIARVLMDMGLLRSRIGTIIIGSAAVNDVIGWLIFTIALSFAVRGDPHQLPIWIATPATIALVAGAVTLFPKWMGRVLNLCERTFGKSAGTTALVLLPTLFLFSALTAYLGVHALFGAFAAGMTVGAVESTDHALRESIERLTLAFFAPFYFVSVGLKANFLADFDSILVVIVLAAAFASKVLAALMGGYLGGLTRRESAATGLGLAARGGIGIILASVAYNAGAIALPMFAALVFMAVATSFSTIWIPHTLSIPESNCRSKSSPSSTC